ncbi:nuclear transport factor 2 family protein [Sphingomonas sp. DT-207]|uniref:nuclear transport factor 2 family protein n=1 Tax=Sphingomonas sp. DT-207 TaxID=3396167 RepID=UPI003F1D7D1C
MNVRQLHSFRAAIAIGALALAPGIASAQSAAARSFPPMPEAERPVWNVTANAQTRAVATRAWTLFRKAWEEGDWQPFLDMTTDDFQFYFPQGAFAGLHEGRAGKAQLLAWAAYHRKAGNRLRSAATHITIAGNTAVFETTAESLPPGGYRNFEAIIFEVQGERVRALREYWNVLQPGSDPSGN